MSHQLSKTEQVVLAGALLLGNIIPTVARAQSAPPAARTRSATMLLKVNDSVVAKHFGTGAQYALYDAKKGPDCIGVFDAAAMNQGKEPLQPAGLKNAAEMQSILDHAQKFNGVPLITTGVYNGPAFPMGECNIGQASTNYAAAAQQTAVPAPSAQTTVQSAMAALSNSVKIVNYEIVKATEKVAQIKITDSQNHQYLLKIEADASILKAFGTGLRESNRNITDGNFKSMNGKSIRVQLDDALARWYNPDGTPQVATENRFLGQTTSTVLGFMDTSTFAEIADKIKAKLGGAEPKYAKVMYGIAAKSGGAAGGQSEVVQPTQPVAPTTVIATNTFGNGSK